MGCGVATAEHERAHPVDMVVGGGEAVTPGAPDARAAAPLARPGRCWSGAVPSRQLELPTCYFRFVLLVVLFGLVRRNDAKLAWAWPARRADVHLMFCYPISEDPGTLI